MSIEKFQTITALSAYQIFSDKMLGKLTKHNIHTSGQLLGATKGLAEIQKVCENDEEKEMMKEFERLIPQATLDEYRNFLFRPPTGLLINPEKDDHENIE